MKRIIYIDQEGFSWKVVKVKDNGTSYQELECVDIPGRQDISAIKQMQIKVIDLQTIEP